MSGPDIRETVVVSRRWTRPRPSELRRAFNPLLRQLHEQTVIILRTAQPQNEAMAVIDSASKRGVAVGMTEITSAIIERAGGSSRLATMLAEAGWACTAKTVTQWKGRQTIPGEWWPRILWVLKSRNIEFIDLF